MPHFTDRPAVLREARANVARLIERAQAAQ